ncbi:aminotransferase-like domain-containing protein [Actinomadura madurae]|uniref:aminotransferase-like domain-containing protein n=1 Tax=Actinomadura madurae TaxID=1993 RepID=UPI0020D1F67B|nr:PLP-dependent aminotransferase family protein [Actinomadura madurae]MCP9976970.1 PLP-dependent aminotransferase family protein [Actinomadura madurae]
MNRSNREQPERSITRGSDFLQLDPSEAPPRGLSDWLAGRLRDAIADGRLPVGSRLPATRVLAAELRVSRGVVTEAYQRLADEGHLAGRGRAGTVVVAAPLTPAPAPAAPTVSASAVPPTASPAPPPGAPFPGEPGADVFDVLRDRPARIDLTPGLPDLAAFPRAAWQRAERTVLRDLPAAALGYGDPRGVPALRTAIAAWLARTRGIHADPDALVVTAGTAQAIGLIARVLARDGIGAVAVEDPGSLGVRQHLRHWGTATPPVPVDADGIRVDLLRDTGAPAVLLTPAHQFPTGVVLGGRRRRELMRWAAGRRPGHRGRLRRRAPLRPAARPGPAVHARRPRLPHRQRVQAPGPGAADRLDPAAARPPGRGRRREALRRPRQRRPAPARAGRADGLGGDGARPAAAAAPPPPPPRHHDRRDRRAPAGRPRPRRRRRPAPDRHLPRRPGRRDR